MNLLQKINKKALLVVAMIALFAFTPLLSGCDLGDLFNFGGEPEVENATVEVYVMNEGLLDSTAQSGIVSINSSANHDYYDSAIVTKGSAVIVTATAQAGYEFEGWYYDGALTELASTNAIYSFLLNEDVSLYASFVEEASTQEYIVYLDRQGGTGGSTTILAIYGYNMPTAFAPERTGYTFGGYYTAINGEGIQYYTASMESARNSDITSSITLYAKWTANTPSTVNIFAYAVTFNSENPSGTLSEDGGTVRINSSSNMDAYDYATVNVGETQNVMATISAGYTFAGWYSNETCTTLVSTNSAYSFTISNTTSLYARFNESEETPSTINLYAYAVTFNSENPSGTLAGNGGVVKVNSSSNMDGYDYATVSAGETQTLVAINGTGYSFVGWYSNSTCATLLTVNSTYSFVAPSANVSYYAKFTVRVCTLFFISYDSNLYDTLNVTYGDSIGGPNMPINPSRTGYTFSGWNTSSNGTGTTVDQYTIITSDMNIYAVWSVNSYNITFDSNGGTGTMNVQVMAYNSSLTLIPNTYTRTGYTFSGWCSDPSGTGTIYANGATYTMGASNVTLYAIWTPIP
ncbi:MAG: InlB B-repeat-containing protein [Spirochaetales bacterium]